MLQVIPNYFEPEMYKFYLDLARLDAGYETVDFSGTAFPSLKLLSANSTLRRYVKGEKQATTWHSDEALGDFITIVGVQKEGLWNGGTDVELPDGQYIHIETLSNTAVRFPAAWRHCREPLNWDETYPRQIYVLFEKENKEKENETKLTK